MRTQLYGQRGDRPQVKDIVFFITDGMSNVNNGAIDREAEAAHAADIDIFAIGVTERASISQLQIIASPPHGEHDDHVFLVNSAVIWGRCKTLTNS